MSETRSNRSGKSEKGPDPTLREDVADAGSEHRSLPEGGQKPRNLGVIAWISVVFAIYSSIFLFALDNTIVADVQPSIVKAFGDVEKLPWVAVAYPLGSISITLTVSKLFSLFENKRVFLAGVLLFEIGSAICGAAPTMNSLIGGRVLCGVGGIVIYVGSMNLISVFTTEAERPLYLNLVGLTWGTGTVLGPIVGGAFADSSATWRWAFYVNLCVGAIAAPAFLFILPSHRPQTDKSAWERLFTVDWVGSVVNAGALATLITGVSFGGGAYDWDSKEIIGLLSASGALWLAFIAQQSTSLFTTKDRRIFPVKYIKSWEMNILFAQAASASTAIYVPLYFIPLFFQFVRGDSAFDAGVRLLPLVFFQIFGGAFSGVMMTKVGYYMPLFLAGGIFTLVGSALLHTLDLGTKVGTVYGYSVLVGLGAGLYTQTPFPVAQLKVSSAEIPDVVAFIGYGQIAGIAIALAISGSLFLTRATSAISAIAPELSRQEVQQAIVGTKGAALATMDAEMRREILSAIVGVMGDVYGMVIAAGALTVVLSLFMRREKLWANRSTEEEQETESSAC